MILTDSGLSDLAADIYPAIDVATSVITGTEPLDGEKREAWYFLAVDLENLYERTAEKGFRNAAKRIYRSLRNIASDPRDGWLDPLLRLSALEQEDGEYAAAISTLEIALRVAKTNQCYTRNIPGIEEEILKAKEENANPKKEKHLNFLPSFINPAKAEEYLASARELETIASRG